MFDIDNLCMQCMKDKGENNVCPFCSYNEEDNQQFPYLPVKHTLQDKYLVGKLISLNGEGVTYIGFDKVLNAPCYIREFLPLNLCTRSSDSWSIKIDENSSETFENLKAKFINLSKGLLKFKDLNGLFPVYDIFEENGTAYYVTEYTECITLNNFLIRNGGKLTYEQCRAIILPVVSTLNELHNANICHYGISPETLFLGKDGKLRLGGFCIPEARNARSDINCELFPGYSAIEQYGFQGKKGVTTDVYSISAVIYRVLVGNAPPEAVERADNDRLSIPKTIAENVPSYSLNALANGLQFLSDDRISTLDVFLDEFSVAPINGEDSDDKKEIKNNKRSVIITVVALVCTIAILATTIFIVGKKFIFKKDDKVSSALEISIVSNVNSFDYKGLEEVTLPDFVGKKYTDAVGECAGLYPFVLQVQSKQYSDQYEAGTIISQSEKSGTKASRTSNIAVIVNVVISIGKSKATIPDFSGYTYEEAFVELTKLGFSAFNIEKQEKYSTSVEKNGVISTEPAAGTTGYDVDQKITIYVSDHTVTSKESSVPSKPSSSSTTSESSSKDDSKPSEPDDDDETEE